MSHTVLVVDDDKLLREGLSESLRDAGLTVSEAEDGQAGLEAALDQKPDMVVTDLKMPEMDGLAMITKLRQDDWGRQVPIIVLTTDEETESLNQAMKAGVTTYLSKNNLSPDTVVEQVRSALGG